MSSPHSFSFCLCVWVHVTFHIGSIAFPIQYCYFGFCPIFFLLLSEYGLCRLVGVYAFDFDSIYVGLVCSTLFNNTLIDWLTEMPICVSCQLKSSDSFSFDHKHCFLHFVMLLAGDFQIKHTPEKTFRCAVEKNPKFRFENYGHTNFRIQIGEDVDEHNVLFFLQERVLVNFHLLWYTLNVITNIFEFINVFILAKASVL